MYNGCDNVKKVLTIAGSDCSGGAGIQADLKTILSHNCYGMSVITALTSQNTRGVYETLDVGASFINSQLDSIFSDIFPDAIIGSNRQLVLFEGFTEIIKEGYKLTISSIDYEIKAAQKIVGSVSVQYGVALQK